MSADESMEDVAYGRQVLEAELSAIQDMIPRMDARFATATDLLHACTGRVVVTGVGKSGLIGQKISATLASTGKPSLFLHSAEAAHGDMGRVLSDDVVLALSYSGTTSEVVRLVPVIKKIGAKLVVITKGSESPLGQAADVTLEVGNIEEACPIGLAPTSSTTAMLALGDALAMTVAHRARFKREDFALFHPGGALGRELVTVGEVMRGETQTIRVRPETPAREALAGLCDVPATVDHGRRSGAILVTDENGLLRGIFTDGDLRRRVVAAPASLDLPIGDIMTAKPRVVAPETLLADAYRMLKEHEFDELPVVDAAGSAVGLLDVQDVLEWGVAF